MTTLVPSGQPHDLELGDLRSRAAELAVRRIAQIEEQLDAMRSHP